MYIGASESLSFLENASSISDATRSSLNQTVHIHSSSASSVPNPAVDNEESDIFQCGRYVYIYYTWQGMLLVRLTYEYFPADANNSSIVWICSFNTKTHHVCQLDNKCVLPRHYTTMFFQKMHLM